MNKPFSLKDFVCEAKLGDITLGAGLDEVLTIFGTPETIHKRTTGMKKRREHKWVFGNFDFFFHAHKLAKVTCSCSDSNKPIKLSKDLKLDQWIIQPGMSAATLRSQLTAHGIAFTEPKRLPYGLPDDPLFLCVSGVRLSCNFNGKPIGLTYFGMSEEPFLPIGLV